MSPGCSPTLPRPHRSHPTKVQRVLPTSFSCTAFHPFSLVLVTERQHKELDTLLWTLLSQYVLPSICNCIYSFRTGREGGLLARYPSLCPTSFTPASLCLSLLYPFYFVNESIQRGELLQSLPSLTRFSLTPVTPFPLSLFRLPLTKLPDSFRLFSVSLFHGSLHPSSESFQSVFRFTSTSFLFHYIFLLFFSSKHTHGCYSYYCSLFYFLDFCTNFNY